MSQKLKIKNFLVKKVIPCFIIALLFSLVSYKIGMNVLKENTETIITITALGKSNEASTDTEVTFRGAAVDGNWYNPIDVIISGEWVVDAAKNTITWDDSRLGNTITIQLPKGDRSITFNAGPDQGMVKVNIDGKELVFDLYNATTAELGLANKLPPVDMSGIVKKVALFAGMVFILSLSLLLVVCWKEDEWDILTKNKQGEKNRAIEAYRFIIIMAVCIHHYCALIPGGYLGVDFFFVLSGFLLMQHYSRTITEDDRLNAGKTAALYTWSRFKRIFPHYLFTIILSLSLSLIMSHTVEFGQIIRNSIWELFMLNASGITNGNLIIGPGWYCSALIIAGFFVYLGLTKSENTYLYVIAPISFLLIFAWMYQNIGNLNRWLQYDTFISTGTLRGFAEMGLGCICFKACQVLKRRSLRELRMFSTMIELMCFAYIFYVMIYVGPSVADFTSVLFMALLITSVFTRNSYLTVLLDNKVMGYLGTISMAIYLNHTIIGRIDWYLLLGWNWNVTLIFYLCIVVVFSCFSTWFVDKTKNIIINQIQTY